MRTALLAGSGRLALEAAKAVKNRGGSLLVITFLEQSAVDFEGLADEVVALGLGQVGKVLKVLKNRHIDTVIFAGKIDKSLLEKNLKLDLKALMMLIKLKDRQEDTIMNAIVDEIQKNRIKVLSQLDVLHDLVPPAGVLGKVKPTWRQMKDVKFAFNKAKGLAGLDIGQTVVVKNKTVLAVESIEGTNATIERGAGFCRGGFTFVKVAKPKQDFRFDMPVTGVETLECFSRSGGSVFALEAGKSLVIDLHECIDYANKHNFALLSYDYAGER